MKRTLTAICVTAAACWVLSTPAMAQSQSGSSSSGSQSGQSGQTGTSGQTDPYGSQSSSSHAGAVTVTGCLEASPDGKTYKLTNVSWGSGSSNSGSTSGTSGSMSGSESSSGSSSSSSGQSSMSGNSSSSASESVELVGGRKVDLKSYVGQKIEVTGRRHGSGSMSSSGMSGSGQEGSSGSSSSGQEGTSGSSSSGQGTSSSSSPNNERIMVESVKPISSSCSSH